MFRGFSHYWISRIITAIIIPISYVKSGLCIHVMLLLVDTLYFGRQTFMDSSTTRGRPAFPVIMLCMLKCFKYLYQTVIENNEVISSGVCVFLLVI